MKRSFTDLKAPIKLIIVGYGSESHIGSHFNRAAQQIENIEVKLFDPSPAFEAPRLMRILNWRLRGKRPARLSAFSQALIAYCESYQPDILLVTGITPPDAQALQQIRSNGVTTVNYLTDDPWNLSHQSTWFLNALPHYDLICSPRRSNLPDLVKAGCRTTWVPFAYEPSIHYPDSPPPELKQQFECDVLFYGGADKDRIPYIKALIKAGIRPHLYGGYWDRYSATRPFYRGMANPQHLRWAVNSAKVTLCMVRRANRDGHVMRSYEVPAMKGCILAEDTEEHRQIFGPEQADALFFKDANQIVSKTSQLLEDPKLRQSLTSRTHHHIIANQNTYYDRLVKILAYTSQSLAYSLKDHPDV